MNREMSRGEEVPHFRIMFHRSDYAGQMTLVRQLRDEAIDVLRPIKIKVRRKQSKHRRELFRANGIGLSWDLNSYDAFEFCFSALRYDLTLSQQAAVELLLFCTIAIEDGVIPEDAVERILYAYRRLDSDYTAIGAKLNREGTT